MSKVTVIKFINAVSVRYNIFLRSCEKTKLAHNQMKSVYMYVNGLHDQYITFEESERFQLPLKLFAILLLRVKKDIEDRLTVHFIKIINSLL